MYIKYFKPSKPILKIFKPSGICQYRYKISSAKISLNIYTLLDLFAQKYLQFARRSLTSDLHFEGYNTVSENWTVALGNDNINFDSRRYWEILLYFLLNFFASLCWITYGLIVLENNIEWIKINKLHNCCFSILVYSSFPRFLFYYCNKYLDIILD